MPIRTQNRNFLLLIQFLFQLFTKSRAVLPTSGQCGLIPYELFPATRRFNPHDLDSALALDGTECGNLLAAIEEFSFETAPPLHRRNAFI
jgi:hypothetical protein